MVSLDFDALRMITEGNIGGAREHMNQKLEKQREYDIKEWIHSNVDLTVYEYDPLEPKEVAEFLEFVKAELVKDKDADPIELLKDRLNKHFFAVYSDWESEIVHESAVKLSKMFNMSFDDAVDVICENTNISYPINACLKDTYKTVIVLDTGDSDYDFTLNQESIEDISDDASLVWLAEQNGYSKDEFVYCMEHINEISKEEHSFIHSVYRELKNTSTKMNGVTFLGEMSLSDLAKAQKEGVTIPKRTTCGLFDGWNGAGSLFEINLQKDIVIPKDVIFSVLPDCSYCFNYGVDNTYGFIDEVWDTPFFAGAAKEFEPEQLDQAKILCAEAQSKLVVKDEQGLFSPDQIMRQKFSRSFKGNLIKDKEYPIYNGMLDRDQFTKAAIRAIDQVENSTCMDSRKEYRFSERHYRNLLQITPTKIPQEVVDAKMKHFEKLKQWSNGK